MASVDRQQLIDQLRSEGLEVTEWSDEAEAAYPEHVHDTREVRVILEGSMSLTVGEVVHDLGPGDRIDLAPGQLHEARVGPDGVRYLAGTAR